MRISDPVKKEKIIGVLLVPEARRILSATISNPKSVGDITEELQVPARSVYRYVDELCELGLLTTERNVLMGTGGKYSLYRSMVKSATFTYEGRQNSLEVDLLPNEDILEKFIRFWTYIAR